MSRVPGAAAATADPFAPRRRGVTLALAGVVVVVAAASLVMGAVAITPSEVVAVLSRHLGLPVGGEPSFTVDAVLWSIRLPRILTGLVVGAALALGGVVLQGLFRNPLADPQLLGVGPGAALGGVIGAVGGGTQGAIAGATVTGLLAALALKRLSGRRAALEPSRFVLTGIAFGAAITAWVGFIVFASDSTKVPPVEFWILGTLSGSTWRALGTATVLAGIGAAGLFASARTLDVLALGESEARHLGLDIELVTTVLLVAVGVTVGATVGAVGVVGFVGLLVPHVVRGLVGPAHRPLLMASALGGAAFVAAADLIARIAISPQEIPVGLVTAAIGGPFFIWLIARAARR